MDTNVESGFIEAAGIIATISKDICDVCVDINGTDTPLSFGKKSFYTWGNQCEGDMTNILEEGMTVNVCYTQSNGNPSISMVWVGEKPDLSNGDVEPLVDVYNQKGTVDRILEDGSFTVRSDMASIVLVKADAFYRDGCSSQVNQKPIAVGESVAFDAMLFTDGEDPQRVMYQATCAWVGQIPRLADRFGLHTADSFCQDLEVLTGDRVFGTVVVIPNGAIAFAYVEDAHEKVMLLRSSFKQESERIQDAVKVGDRLCLCLRFSYIFPGCRQWFAEKAWKYGEDVSWYSWMTEPVISSISALPMDKVMNDFYNDEGKKNTFFNESNEVLYGDPPLKGVFNFLTKGKSKSLITFGKINIAAKLRNIYVGDGSKKDKARILTPNSVVNFEAVLKYPQGKKYKKNTVITHEAVCVWIGQKPTFSEFARNLLTRATTFPGGKVRVFGTVSQFCLPEKAVVSLTAYKNFTVCLHANELVSDSLRDGDRKNLICDVVRLGDCLSSNIIQHPECGDFLCAVNIKLLSVIPNSKLLDVARVPNEFSCDINKGPASLSESDDVHLSRSDDENSDDMLRGNASLPDVLFQAIPKTADVTLNCTAKTSKALHNKANNPITKNSRVLWNDPPLRGICCYISDDKPIIVYKNLKILFTPANFYVDGLHCGTVDEFMSLCKSLNFVQFEGSKILLKALTNCGIFHRTDLVWIGEKPCFSTVANTVGLVDEEMLTVPEKTFVGIVAKYYFPDIAVIKVKNGPVNAVVSLDTESFIVKPQCSSINILEFISDFVNLQDKLEFKVMVKETSPLILRAYNARKLTKAEYDAVSNHS